MLKRLLKSDGPFVGALALVAFVGIFSAAWLAQSIPAPPIAASDQQQYAEGNKEGPTKFAALFLWIDANHNAIEAGSVFISALFTIALVGSTIGLWIATGNIATDAADGRQRTERAYVKISHHADFAMVANDQFRIRFNVKNFGRTPARVLDVRIEMFQEVEPPPNPPPFDNRQRIKIEGFLVAGDDFDRTITYRMTTEQWNAMVEGKRRVWLYGYVEYVDVFGFSHRAGYGRIYSRPPGDFIFIPGAGYNYDRPLTLERNQEEKGALAPLGPASN